MKATRSFFEKLTVWAQAKSHYDDYDFYNILKTEIIKKSGISEWRILAFKYFQEPGSQPKELIAESVGIESTVGVWQTRKDHTAAPLVVRISNFAHFAVLQGGQVVESYFMIMAKKWIKAVYMDEEVMLLVREQNQVRRIRLTFKSDTDAIACYTRLASYVSVKPTKCPSSSEELEEKEEGAKVAQWLQRMLPSDGSAVAAFADPAISAAWQTEWPTENLSHLIKLCLLDPNFPGFARHVHEALKNTLENNDLADDTTDDSEEL